MQPLIQWISRVTPYRYLRFIGWANLTLPMPTLFWLVIFFADNDSSNYTFENRFEEALFSAFILFLVGIIFFIWAWLIKEKPKN